MENTLTPRPEQWLRDAETIKVFADPLRLRMIRLMQEPTTVKQVAEQLAIVPAKLYYHINLLLKHELIQVVGHNLESGIVEKIYQVSARQFKLVNPLIAGEDFPEDAAITIFRDMLENAMAGFQRAYPKRDRTVETPLEPFFSQKQFRLNSRQLSLLHSRLDELIKEVSNYGVENFESSEPGYELTLVFYKTEEA